jgi:uncharacterized membrane protein
LLQPIHPLQAILLASALPLFAGVLLCDLAYASSYQVQWKNFASWLLVGGLAPGVVTFVLASVDFARFSQDRGMRRVVYLAALLVMCVTGIVNALVHAGDAWASMPEGIVLSGITAASAVTAVWLGFSNYRARVLA